MRHDVLIYGDDDRLAAEAAPFLLEGVEEGEYVVTVLNAPHTAVVREALGPGADAVQFIDHAGFYTRPEAALAAYDATVRRALAAGAPSVRAVAELPRADSSADWDRWLSYEAIVNRALARHACSIICAYDRRDVPDEVVATARATHPSERDGGHRHETPMARSPEDLVRDMAPVPMSAPEHLLALPVGEHGLGLRTHLARALADAGLADEAAADALVALGEVVANAERHGGGVAALRVGRDGDGVVCEVVDRGPGITDPIAGYIPPDGRDREGNGLWVARQLSRRLEAVRTPEGPTVRVWL